MAKFTRDILLKMNKVAHELEVTLGPGTSELGMRFGLHSGAVTAGVVRGQNARFQLFGDVRTESLSNCSWCEEKWHTDLSSFSWASADDEHCVENGINWYAW